MADILVVKVNMFLRPKEMDDISNYIRKSAKTGVIILPPYCEAQVVPEDVEVRIENPYDQKEEPCEQRI